MLSRRPALNSCKEGMGEMCSPVDSELGRRGELEKEQLEGMDEKGKECSCWKVSQWLDSVRKRLTMWK